MTAVNTSVQTMLSPDAEAFTDDYFAIRRMDARKGSRRLKWAILAAQRKAQ